MFACAWISAARTFAMSVPPPPLAERRNKCLAVLLDDRLWLLHHRVVVERDDAHLDLHLDPLAALLHGADNAEPVDHVIGDEVGMSRPALGVLRVVVMITGLDVVG